MLKGSRIIWLYGGFIFLFGLLICRLYYLIQEEGIGQAVESNFGKVMEIGETRGTIYDRNYLPITNSEGYNVAAVMPCLESQAVLLEETAIEQRVTLLERFKEGNPFTLPVSQDTIYSKGITVFRLYNHLKDNQEAAHVVGYFNHEGQGVSGLEYALDDYLKATGGQISIRYTANAVGNATSEGEVLDSGYHSGAGVVTTIDLEIQKIIEQAGKEMQKGAIVVQEIKSGDLLGVASFPTFSPNDLGASLDDPDNPFINRAFTAYSVGSTFKLLVAATALEQGYSPSRLYRCDGFVTVGEHDIACHFAYGHGEIDMTYALEQSCNPYFITLATQIGGATLAYKASLMDFGVSNEFTPNYGTQSGNLPSYESLASLTATANFAIGQGDLLATPVHVASLVSTIANGGKYNTPRLILGYTNNGYAIQDYTTIYSARQVFTESAADTVCVMMESVVENGSGKSAMPEAGGAGGKTASAQSGQYKDGEEIVQTWFSGYFPAQNPEYTIVVLVEDGESGTVSATPIFKEIADNILQKKG